MNKINQRVELFERIKQFMLKDMNLRINATSSGRTQDSGTAAENKVKQALDSLGLYYERATSQRSKDFQNIERIGLNIEVKKSDTGVIKCNDTRPTEDVFYIIFLHQAATERSKYSPSIWFGLGDELCANVPPEHLSMILKGMEEYKKLCKSCDLGNLGLDPRFNWYVNCNNLAGKIELKAEQ
jgi:hypothetical protein